MTTENNDSEADNEIPPVARFLGRAVSEWVVYSFIAFSISAAIFGSMVGGERDAQAERAMVTLSALTEAAENKAAAGSALVCNDSLLPPELLANDYLTLSIRQAPINEDNKSLGYGPALYVSVEEKEVSGDTWDTAKRLMDLVKEAGEKEAQASEERSGGIITANVASGEEGVDKSTEDEKPENRLREVRKKGFGEDEDYLRYYILASEVAICSQGA
ncbi:MAG: hypothetical protein NXH95_04205 [Pseudomonadaceae bacterium]|nr:hypothetical protein [Pseudomonadaceae bacterium]